jgi:S1-C subfamily serine protease
MTRRNSVQPQAIAISGKASGGGAVLRLAALAVLSMAVLLMQAVTALARPESLAPLADRVSPAVVNITTTTVVEGRTGPQGIVPGALRSRISSGNFRTVTETADGRGAPLRWGRDS